LLPILCPTSSSRRPEIEPQIDIETTDETIEAWGRSAPLTSSDPAARLDAFIANQSRIALWTEAFLLASIIGVIDFGVTNEVNMALFQLLPVMFATWYISRRAGILFSFLTLGSWVTTDILSGVHFSAQIVPYWNGVVRLVFFLVLITLTWVMRDAKRQAQELSRTDSLTGVANGRSFAERAALEVLRMHRNAGPVTLAYVDLDRFKHINDTRGHTEGDRLLQTTAAAVAERIRSTDFVARLGGDEFAVLLPDTSAEAAPKVLAAVEAAVSHAIHDGWGVGCTIGAVTFETAPPSVDYMVRLADDLMYRGKRAGRGRIIHAAWESLDKGFRATGGRSSGAVASDDWDDIAGATPAVRPAAAAVERVSEPAGEPASEIAV
jgi:diguanylate cyclase (GGDEF)-like protein